MSYTFELNNERKDENFVSGTIKSNSPVVEIFSAMVQGKDLSSFGVKADKAAKYITELNNKAAVGDVIATAELNNIRRLSMEPVLLKEIKLLSIFGNYTPIGYNESCEVEVPVYANVTASIQAAGQDVSFPVARKRRVSVPTIVISGGHAVDYRKAALGNMTEENELQEEVRKQIRNKASKYVINTVYTAIKNATGVKYFFEGAGLTKTGADGVIGKVRRFGKPNIWGDYALISQFNPWAGYVGTTPTINGISEAVMKEIHDTGIMGAYNGSIITEIPNEYDLSTLDAAGTNFNTVLPQGLGFVAPTGTNSPVYNVTRGGLTSFTGNDVTSGTIMTRFDLEVGCIIVPDQEYKIGMLYDTNLGGIE